MTTQTKTCQNCQKEFTIEPEDFEFYEKISSHTKARFGVGQEVPAPTWCPGCRLINRRTFRNERTLYYRECDLCGEKILSMYSPEKPFPVYCHDCWWGDKWDPLDCGHNYDFDRPFFEQLKELHEKVPHPSLVEINNKNCPYVNYTWFSNNSYMCWDLGYGENILYSNACHFLKDSVDCTYSKNIELCYECIYTRESSRSAFLKECTNCLDSYFLRNCRNCSSCILCENLRNKSYCILNKQYTKEEYARIKQSFIDGSFLKIAERKKDY